MSNSSLGAYPENTLSAFTNVLARSCKITEEWSVGLSEIYFNPIPNTRSSRLRRTNPLAESSGDDYDDDKRIVKDFDDGVIEVFAPIKKKRRKRRDNNDDDEQIEIKVNENYKIVLRGPDLEDICYQKHDLNGGKLLESLSTKFERIFGEGTREELKATERFTKEAMLKRIVRTDWSKEPLHKLKSTRDDFTVHIYMGSSKSDNIVLKFGKYANIGDFVAFIIRQIPMERRKTHDLILLFNIFLYQLQLNTFIIINDDEDKKKDNDNPYVKIFFDEYGTNANLDTRTFTDEPIDLITLVKKFREGLVFKDEVNMDENDKKQIRLAIGQAVLDVLRGNNFDVPQIKKAKSKFSVNLRVPYAKKMSDGPYDTYTTIVEPKHYQRMYDFLTEIYNQIPPEKRNSEVFIETLNNVFLETEGLTEKREVDYKDSVETSTVIQPPPPPPPTPVETSEIVQPPPPPAPVETSEVVQLPTPQPVPVVNQKVTKSVNDTGNFLYVYCDLIKPRYIADQFARFLRVIPLSDSIRHIRFTHIEYCPLERIYFDSVSILLTDSYGQRIKFNASTIPTYVMLHFKKKKKESVEKMNK